MYEAHEAFEIDKTKMKMLVPLDMNGKKIMNTNYDLKFKDLFKIFKCYFKVGQGGIRTLLHSKFNNQVVSFTSPVVLHSINLHKTGFNNEKNKNPWHFQCRGYIHKFEPKFIIYIYEYDSFHNDVYNRFWNKMRRYKGTDFDVDLALAFN